MCIMQVYIRMHVDRSTDDTVTHGSNRDGSGSEEDEMCMHRTLRLIFILLVEHGEEIR